MDERWSGNAFQMFEATDENDLEFVMVVFRGEHILTTMKKSRVLALVHIVGWELQDRMVAEIGAP